MLRVFRPSSPMNMGTWILSAFGLCTGLASLPAVSRAPEGVRRMGDFAWRLAGLVGLPLTGYTGALLADTAVPLWQGARRTLPVLFSLSGASAAASILELFPARAPEAKAVHRFGMVAKAAEIAATFALEREVSLVPRVARPLRTGLTGALWRAARALTFGSLVLSLARRNRRAVVQGLLGTAGAVALRFALLQAGRRSTRDPRAAFEQQRAGRAELPGSRPPVELGADRSEKEKEANRRDDLHA
jgi:formate-dependent nitrite reductase membrane component NrfD